MRARERILWRTLAPMLTADAWRRVPVWYLAELTALDRRTVYRALDGLRVAGLLDARDATGGHAGEPAREFRLVTKAAGTRREAA